MATILMLIGAFAPLQISPNTNSTEWDKIKELFKELGKNRKLGLRLFFIRIFYVPHLLV